MQKFTGRLRPVKDRVIVQDMEFGEQITKSGLVLRSDDGKSEGIKPRWGKVYAKGPTNKDEYQVGNWVLVEHGRWTRGVVFNEEDGSKITLRMVEAKSIMLASTSEEKPTDYPTKAIDYD